MVPESSMSDLLMRLHCFCHASADVSQEPRQVRLVQQLTSLNYKRHGRELAAWLTATVDPTTGVKRISTRNLNALCATVERIPHLDGAMAAFKLLQYNTRQHGALLGIPMPPAWSELPLAQPGRKALQESISNVWLALDPAMFGPQGPAGPITLEGDAAGDGAQQPQPQQLPDGAYVLWLEYVLHMIVPLSK